MFTFSQFQNELLSKVSLKGQRSLQQSPSK